MNYQLARVLDKMAIPLHKLYEKIDFYIPLVRLKSLSKGMKEYKMLNKVTSSAFANDIREEKRIEHEKNVYSLKANLSFAKLIEGSIDLVSIAFSAGAALGNYTFITLPISLQLIFSYYYFKRQMKSLKKESNFCIKRTALIPSSITY